MEAARPLQGPPALGDVQPLLEEAPVLRWTGTLVVGENPEGGPAAPGAPRLEIRAGEFRSWAVAGPLVLGQRSQVTERRRRRRGWARSPRRLTPSASPVRAWPGRRTRRGG